ncbi:MAG: uracil-DNA glycosylase family protein [Candidatus Nanosyncoccus sp.]
MNNVTNNFTKIRDALISDERNSDYSKRGILPIYQVSEEAKILIIGQAPGAKVEENGIPFMDKSGEKLRDWMGVDEATFYSKRIAIMPMDFYFPGRGKTGDLPPRKFIAEDYHEKILALMPKIKLTILIGEYAIKNYLKDTKKENLTETVRCFQEYLPKYFPIVHPSPLNFRWQAKNPWFEKDVVPMLRQKVHEILG